MQAHPWLKDVENDNVDIAEWVQRIVNIQTPTQ